MRLVAGTIDRAFQIQQHTMIVSILGDSSSLTDIFYCQGIVGVFTTIYLTQVLFRERFYFDNAMYYI
jgi:uncharacterized membrane protein YuzA (DUF378 family)